MRAFTRGWVPSWTAEDLLAEEKGRAPKMRMEVVGLRPWFAWVDILLFSLAEGGQDSKDDDAGLSSSAVCFHRRRVGC